MILGVFDNLFNKDAYEVKISFIIPTLNEAQMIGAAIDSIHVACKEFLTYEIIVSDHGSTDNTVEIAIGRHARVINPVAATIGALRNAGVRVATGDVLVFLDADVTLSIQWRTHIHNTLASLNTNYRQITGSRSIPPPNEHFLHKFWFSALAQEPDPTHIGTPHMIMTRRLFEELGGFNENLRTGEDYEISVRAKKSGARIVPDQKLVAVQNRLPVTVMEFIRRERWHGLSDAASLRSVFHSRVALMTVGFIALHFCIAFSLTLRDLSWAFFFAILLTGHLYITAKVKLRTQRPSGTLGAILVVYIYYLGRSLSFLPAERLRWMER